MTEKLKQTIKEELEKLPKDIREAINSIDWAKITEEIGKKYLLDEEEINDLQAETLTVLIGLSDLDSYAEDIEDEIGTTKKDADSIAGEAFEKIFTPINDVMKENIKKNIRMKDPSWEQTLNFILSGGDYSVFMAPSQTDKEISEPPLKPTTPPTFADIKANTFKTNVPISPKRMTDLKSQFKI